MFMARSWHWQAYTPPSHTPRSGLSRSVAVTGGEVTHQQDVRVLCRVCCSCGSQACRQAQMWVTQAAGVVLALTGLAWLACAAGRSKLGITVEVVALLTDKGLGMQQRLGPCGWGSSPYACRQCMEEGLDTSSKVWFVTLVTLVDALVSGRGEQDCCCWAHLRPRGALDSPGRQTVSAGVQTAVSASVGHVCELQRCSAGM
jgi:hypothetical protein